MKKMDKNTGNTRPRGGERGAQTYTRGKARRFALTVACAIVAGGTLGATAQTSVAAPGQADVTDRMLRLADTLTEMSLRMGNLFGGASDYRLYRIYAGKQLDFKDEFFKNLNGGWASNFGFDVDEAFGTFTESVLADVRSNLIELGTDATPQQVMTAVATALGTPSLANGGSGPGTLGGGSQTLASNAQFGARSAPSGGGRIQAEASSPRF